MAATGRAIIPRYVTDTAALSADCNRFTIARDTRIEIRGLEPDDRPMPIFHGAAS